MAKNTKTYKLLKDFDGPEKYKAGDHIEVEEGSRMLKALANQVVEIERAKPAVNKKATARKN